MALDRPDLGTVLLALRTFLRLFVIVEFAFDPFAGAVEDVDDAP